MGDEENVILALLEVRVCTITIITSAKGIIRIYNIVRIRYYIVCDEGKQLIKTFLKKEIRGGKLEEIPGWF